MENIEEYFDDKGRKLHLVYGQLSEKFIREDIGIILDGIPYLINEDTRETYLTPFGRVLIEKLVGEAKTKGIRELTISPPKHFTGQRFKFCDDLPFKYSALEYFSIPGLAREFSNDGFLVPIYFNIEVLNKYSQNPDYELHLMSSTYGNLYFKDEWSISFGVNRNKSVIMWLGDIDKLPKKEQFYLLSENIEPDYEVHSEFYEGQICVQWAEGSLESKVFELRENLSELILDKFGSKLFKLDGEISKVLSNLQKPVFWQDKHVAPVIEALNRIFVESLCEKNIKEIIKNESPETGIKGLRGLKLLTVLLNDVLEIENSAEIMCPFFVLYDYRVVMCHLQSEESVNEKMDSIFYRLHISDNDKHHETVYMSIFEFMKDSLSRVIEHIGEKANKGQQRTAKPIT
ncbi:hypothetical protein EKN56_09445 [Limnobaculum zhutongyuii]|uniref:Uncharacterized protein n=1 Tax=Limnobaculum zhutongyuii TaxID=2498113 RepID=A0A411WK76_9GAMM|nr:hypothetical protein [Limnobaculum zhutongyuii]QBH96611.1 hypothetical protein EKN56_09445 [Limnobaculum zhutongyuii]TQS90358.1 hypothetical protein ELQ32_03140 [Limnobaculum zhutongyuii]